METTFAYRLFTLIENKGISTKDLAIKIGVNVATVTNWLNGKSIPNKLRIILVLSDCLEVSPSYFLNILRNNKKKRQ